MKLRSAFDALLAFESLRCENAYNARAADVYAFGLLQAIGKMREVEVVILFPVEAEHVMANPLSYPVLGVPVPVTVNEAHFALSRVLLPEPDDLPPTEAHKQTASSLRL